MMAIDKMQLLPSYDQMQAVVDQITRIARLQEAAVVEDSSLSALEQSLAKRRQAGILHNRSLLQAGDTCDLIDHRLHLIVAGK